MKLAASLHRVGSDLVNIYLVEESGGITVVDGQATATRSSR